jgi:hypothetical protein
MKILLIETWVGGPAMTSALGNTDYLLSKCVYVTSTNLERSFKDSLEDRSFLQRASSIRVCPEGGDGKRLLPNELVHLLLPAREGEGDLDVVFAPSFDTSLPIDGMNSITTQAKAVGHCLFHLLKEKPDFLVSFQTLSLSCGKWKPTHSCSLLHLPAHSSLFPSSSSASLPLLLTFLSDVSIPSSTPFPLKSESGCVTMEENDNEDWKCTCRRGPLASSLSFPSFDYESLSSLLSSTDDSLLKEMKNDVLSLCSSHSDFGFDSFLKDAESVLIRDVARSLQNESSTLPPSPAPSVPPPRSPTPPPPRAPSSGEEEVRVASTEGKEDRETAPGEERKTVFSSGNESIVIRGLLDEHCILQWAQSRKAFSLLDENGKIVKASSENRNLLLNKRTVLLPPRLKEEFCFFYDMELGHSTNMRRTRDRRRGIARRRENREMIRKNN